jgi:methionine-rich copper-binding protein CopC
MTRLDGTTHRSLAARAARLALAPVLALGLLAAGAVPASAHSGLVSTDPGDGATIDSAPHQVTLTFNEAPQSLGTEIVVLGPDGSQVSDGEAVVADVSVTQPLQADLPAGAYAIQWRVTSADGHPLSGELSFTATSAVGPGAAPSADAGASTHPEPTSPATIEPPAPRASASPEPAASGTAEDQVEWRWGPTSVVVLSLIAAVAAGLVFLAFRLRRRSEPAASRDEPADGRADRP